MLYQCYTIFGTVVFSFFQLLAPFAHRIGGRFGYRLAERFGCYARAKLGASTCSLQRIWIHAASVGEVQAAVYLIAELERQGSYRFIVTVMTEQGHRVGEKKLRGRATCLLAPLDAPFIVRRALASIRPDLFVCVETEIWPVLLTELRKARVRMCQVNGRLSERSFGRYLKIKGLMERLLSGFDALCVISPEDGERFAALGVAEEKIRVSGNSKYAHIPLDREQVAESYRKRLGLEDALVFISGSTRTGEEELLVPVFEQLGRITDKRVVWIIAPRHLERVAMLADFFAGQQLDIALYTDVQEGVCSADILLLDCMGELADLYAAGDFIFCGGSLVAKGGHNIMEIIRWGLPVYFGPSMEDFRDAVQLVVPVGAGFQVANSDELADLLQSHLENRTSYERACRAAEDLSMRQGSAVKVQADMVRGLL